jgi:CHAD domain-containing protein
VAIEQLEREHKYSAAEQYRLPDLDAVLPHGGRVEQATVALDSVYFDTEEHDLLAHGVTLRRRTGPIDNGWHLKVPSGDTRTEIRLELEAADGAVPDELATLTLGVRRGKPLRQIVTIRTSRTAHRLLDAEGRVIIEVADDHVDAVAPGHGSATLNSWREIEAELGAAGTVEDLDTVDARLIESGLQAAAGPNKVATALGATSTDTHDTDREDGDQTAGDVIRDYLREQDNALVAGDLSLRRGLGAIHPTRVATRRLRSTLRIFADYFDADRAKKLDVELSWYAEILGQVRDREVQRSRFAEAIAALPDELVLGPVAADIEQYLLREQLQHQAALDKAMRGRRYLALLKETRRWATEPPFTALAKEVPLKLRKPVRAAARKVDRHLAAGLATQDDDELHKARKAGKRARYAAELAYDLLGKKTRKNVKQYQKLQDILGDHQDGVVAADLLRRLAARTADNPQENGFTYGLLYAREQHRAEISRRRALAWAKKR